MDCLIRIRTASCLFKMSASLSIGEEHKKLFKCIPAMTWICELELNSSPSPLKKEQIKMRENKSPMGSFYVIMVIELAYNWTGPFLGNQRAGSFTIPFFTLRRYLGGLTGIKSIDPMLQDQVVFPFLFIYSFL